MAKKTAKGHRGSEVKAPPKGSGGPPSAKAREDRAKSTREPPPVKYAGKKKPPRYTRPDMPDWGDMPWPKGPLPGGKPKPRKPKRPIPPGRKGPPKGKKPIPPGPKGPPRKPKRPLKKTRKK